MIITRRNVLIKIETTKGTDAVPTLALDAVRVENPQFSYVESLLHPQESVKPSFGFEQTLYGGSLGQFTFEANLKGSGSAVDDPPELDPALRACGLGRTINAATSVVYAPISTGQPSATIEFEDDGQVYKMLGSLGNMAVALEARKPARATFTFMGHVVDPVDQALGTPTLDSVVPPSWLGSAFTLDSVAHKVSTLSVDLGNEITKLETPTAADGFDDLEFVGRAVSGSCNPVLVVPSSYDWVTKWQANSLVPLDTGVIGSVANNRLQINLPRAQYQELAPADRDKLNALEVSFNGVINSGDDEISFTFT